MRGLKLLKIIICELGILMIMKYILSYLNLYFTFSGILGFQFFSF
jgi:hypothetical protein